MYGFSRHGGHICNIAPLWLRVFNNTTNVYRPISTLFMLYSVAEDGFFTCSCLDIQFQSPNLKKSRGENQFLYKLKLWTGSKQGFAIWLYLVLFLSTLWNFVYFNVPNGHGYKEIYTWENGNITLNHKNDFFKFISSIFYGQQSHSYHMHLVQSK